ncbi:MAG: site-specific DNA-methyltransferase [Endomicrobium sp.]|jgi:adenine specific DNA methylase Mod|nr:site-specific DNA-methyltransferase [Endomicrobium sp.]
MQNFSKESLNITEEKLNKFKQLFPEVFSEGKVDFERLKLILGESVSISNERYVLNWADKSEAFTAIQTPTTKTLYPVPEESIKFNSSENVFIEGENLEVLKILQKSYFGKIKMIYIDPPYNTGNDNFIYPDKFSETKEEYLKKIKEKDEKGYLLKEGLFHKNSKENGQFHSNWLNMMYPRLFLAKNLLKDDGVIFISIDDNEVHNLRLLMNEIFGEENFVSEIVWANKEGGGGSDSTYYKIKHEYILCYAKNKENLIIKGEKCEEDSSYCFEDEFKEERGRYKLIKLNSFSIQYSSNLDYPITLPNNEMIYPSEDGKKGCWRWSKEKFYWGLKHSFIEFKKNQDGKIWVYTKQYFRVDNENKQIVRTLPPSALIDKYSSTMASKQMEELLDKKGFFNYPKPVFLIKELIYTGNDNNSTTLDFFAGSGTTAQAVMELNKEDGGNRKFICVQLPEKAEENSEAFKAGYKTIAEISKERIRRAAKKIEAEAKENLPALQGKECLDLGFKVYKLKESNFKIWRSDMVSAEEELEAGIDMFENPLKDGAKEENILLELLLKCGYNLNVKAEIIEADNAKIYAVNDNELIVCLEKISDKIISKILELKPARCLMLDSLFDGRDSFKTNIVLQLQDAEIDLVVI